jgi:hypothetical protein
LDFLNKVAHEQLALLQVDELGTNNVCYSDMILDILQMLISLQGFLSSLLGFLMKLVLLLDFIKGVIVNAMLREHFKVLILSVTLRQVTHTIAQMVLFHFLVLVVCSLTLGPIAWNVERRAPNHGSLTDPRVHISFKATFANDCIHLVSQIKLPQIVLD